MAMFTLKIIKIEETGSIGRQLKAYVNANGAGTKFGFNGSSSKHHIVLKDAEIGNKALVIPVSIQVSETDKKYTDGPYPTAGKFTIDPSKGDKTDLGSLSVLITEIGAKGKSKDKKATLKFYLEANITCREGKNNRTTSQDGIDFITTNEGGIKKQGVFR